MTTRPNYQSSVGLMLFATAYDPLDLASDSIDPLGFLRAYLSLADRLLPGFTTVTSVPRYLPMLCAGVRAAERLHPRDKGHEPAKARGRRLEVLRNFEKLWALACGLAEETRGKPAIAGLRGIRYVRSFLEANAARPEINVGGFNLLANQVRYGGIGTYGQMLEACHFADWAMLTLRPLGENLADAFPSPPAWSSERPNARIAKDTLRAWGEEVCLERMTASEASTIREGLNGGLEAERDDDLRWNCLRLLKAAGAASGAGEEACLERFRGIVEQEPLGDARKSVAIRQLRVVALLIEPFEQLYQSLLFFFDEMRARATENPAGCLLASLDESDKAADALSAAQRSQRDLRNKFTIAEQVDAAVTAPIALAMHESGISPLAELIAAAGTAAEAAGVLLQRHAAVQSGKFDRGQQKTASLWLDNGTARISAQRNGLLRGQHATSWRNIDRHPYRTSAAGRFIQQCRIA
jgi:hypothetical protein